jgi:hypothetical protein
MKMKYLNAITRINNVALISFNPYFINGFFNVFFFQFTVYSRFAVAITWRVAAGCGYFMVAFFSSFQI